MTWFRVDDDYTVPAAHRAPLRLTDRGRLIVCVLSTLLFAFVCSAGSLVLAGAR